MERAFIDPIFSDELNHEFEIACRLTDEAIAQFVNEIHSRVFCLCEDSCRLAYFILVMEY